MTKNICIIPARGGSKRIKNKNIKNFCGKPIIAQVILKLKKTSIFNEIVVSTDSSKIYKIAKKYNVNRIFMRPKNLSGDNVSTSSVVQNIISSHYKTSKNHNFFCVYPTSVFLKKKNIIDALKLIKKEKKKLIFSAVKYSHPIQRSFFLKNNKIVMNFKKYLKKRTQDYSNSYHDAAQFYLGKSSTWNKTKTILSSNSCIVELKKNEIQDIDDIQDWKLAEIIFKKTHKVN